MHRLRALAVLALTAAVSCSPPGGAPPHDAIPANLRATLEGPAFGARRSATAWTTSAEALAFIKNIEGLRLTAYSLADQWLIGYGHAAGVEPGMTITRDAAEAMLASDLSVCEQAIGDAVTVPVTEDEFSAMASLCFNIGATRFAGSLVVQRLNAGDRKGAADAFRYWRKATFDGTSRVVPLLAERRERERALFLGETLISSTQLESGS